LPPAAPLTEKAHAKINLTLRVVGRRADGYHELESLVVFAGVADMLTLRVADDLRLDIGGPFAAAIGPVDHNLVLKAESALRQRVSGLKAGHFHLDKRIPVAGGVGGGSADAAAALRLLASANGIALGDVRLAEAALAVGADVPVCLESKPRMMRGIGERLSAPIVLPKLAAVLVNPGVALATKDVFGAFAGSTFAKEDDAEVPRDRAAFIKYLEHHGNDLTPAAIASAPVVGEVLDALGERADVRLVRMSGSGPTCFALFDKETAAASAAKELEVAYPGWWVHSGAIG
jgi:4-diphosphocytidyl-2-C-methyl-D-erythritol kinase